MCILKNTKKRNGKKLVLGGVPIYAVQFDPVIEGTLFSDKLKKANVLLEKTVFLKQP
ncbi:hypothetical protein [Niabella sp.]|uniref:hypothetical protein n=1 Tax=Niabella sp. TaxID=1962976 RepID=UPI002635E5E5|nr:hypothetical protein [Niabella sp.]